MRFTATTDFKHGVFSFEKEKTYDVPDDVAKYFINNGWATSEHYQPLIDRLPELEVEHVLEIQDSIHVVSGDAAKIKTSDSQVG